MSNLIGSTSDLKTLQIVADALLAVACLIVTCLLINYTAEKTDAASRRGVIATTIIFVGVGLLQLADIWALQTGGQYWRLLFKLVASVVALLVSALMAAWHPYAPSLKASEHLEERAKELEAEAALLKERLEETIRAAQLKMAFLANLSHELRTPLSAVVGTNELLLNSMLNDEQSQLATACGESAAAMQSMIDDLHSLSDVEGGQAKLELATFSAQSLIRSAMTACMGAARHKKLFFNTDVDPAIPAALLGDERRMRQILVHLLRNSIRHTDEGGIIVQAQIVDQADTAVRLRFSVRDTGLRLGEKQKRSLLQPFMNDDGTVDTTYGETDLGLYMSRVLVDILGGEIGAEPNREDGSTYWFAVNVAPVHTA